MHTSRRSILAAAGVAMLGGAAAASVSADIRGGPVGATVAELIERSAVANDVLMRGDIHTYNAMIPIADDFTLMAPFGGTPTRGSDLTSERMEAMGRFFKNGTSQQEVVQAYGSADLVVLAIIERAHVEVGGLPAQEWALRVTLVYRRDGSTWRLTHRHADPLAHGINLEQAAVLGRGERAALR
jgi:ketosteroid isomerase-like protein